MIIVMQTDFQMETMVKSVKKAKGWLKTLGIAAAGALTGIVVYCLIGEYGARQEAENRRMLREAAMRDAVEALLTDIEHEDRLLAFHHALSAADAAEKAGREQDALYYLSAAEKIRAGTMPDGDAVRRRLDGETDERATESETPTEEPDAVARIRETSAKETAALVLGIGSGLHIAEKSPAGTMLLYCRNGYVLMDQKSGRPLEAMLSLPAGERRLSDSACVEKAREAAAFCFPDDPVTGVGSVRRVGESVVEVRFIGEKAPLSVSIRTDTGRTVALHRG